MDDEAGAQAPDVHHPLGRCAGSQGLMGQDAPTALPEITAMESTNLYPRQEIQPDALPQLAIGDGPGHRCARSVLLPMCSGAMGFCVIDKLEEVRGNANLVASNGWTLGGEDRPCDDIHIALGPHHIVQGVLLNFAPGGHCFAGGSGEQRLPG